MKMVQTRWLLLVTVTLLLAAVGAPAWGLSVEGRFHMGPGDYTLTGGSVAYEEKSNWQLYAIRAEMPLAGLGNVFVQYSTGQASDIDVLQGAPVTDLTGSKSQQIIGGELLLNPLPILDIGAGVGYFSDQGTNTWRAQHPGGPGVPPFAPGDTLDWSVERRTSGIMLLLSAGADLGPVHVGARVGYGPSMAWSETIRAEKDANWEQWVPKVTSAPGALYEVNARFNLPGGLALVGGLQGSALNSPALDELESAYSNSNNEQATVVDLDVPQAVERMFNLYAGLRYAF